MDLNLLPLFVTVAEASSFTVAATKLGVERSSVSRGIAALERSLKVQLFSRTTRHVALTTAGSALYAKLAPGLAALEDALGTVPEREEEPSGVLRVTAPNDIGSVILPQALAGFALRHPAVRVDVRLDNRKVDLVAEGFDVALRASASRLSDSSLVVRRMCLLEMQIFGSASYLARAGAPRTPEEALEHHWVAFRGLKLPAQLQKAKARARIEGDDILFVYQAVKAGTGLGVVPWFLARDDVASGQLVRVLPRIALPSATLFFVHPPAKHLPRKVTAFRDFLLQHFAAHPLAR